MVVAVAAAEPVEVVLEIARLGRGGSHRGDCLGRQKRAPEVGVEDGAGEVEHGAQMRRGPGGGEDSRARHDRRAGSRGRVIARPGAPFGRGAAQRLGRGLAAEIGDQGLRVVTPEQPVNRGYGGAPAPCRLG